MKFTPKAEAATKDIIDQVMLLVASSDSRLMAPVLGTLSARLYQALLAAGIHTEAEIRQCMTSFTTLVLEPRAAAPAVSILGNDPVSLQ